jgi:hypothetical protein
LSGGLVEAAVNIAAGFKKNDAFWRDRSLELVLETGKFEKSVTVSRTKANTIPMQRASATSVYSVSSPV